jgi:hypothetical protein
MLERGSVDWGRDCSLILPLFHVVAQLSRLPVYQRGPEPGLIVKLRPECSPRIFSLSPLPTAEQPFPSI